MEHSLPIDNTTYRPFTEKLGDSNAQEFVGNPGDLFWDPNNGDLNFSDGVTPGGVGLKTRRIDITTRYVDQYQWVQTFVNESDFRYDDNYDYGSGIAVGSDGYAYMLGGSDNYTQAYVVKFGADSTPNYFYDNAQYLSNSANCDYSEAITVHQDSVNGDSIYALLSNNGGGTILLVKLDDGLNVQWSRSLSANGGDVVTDGAGNVYVVGWSSIGGGNKLIVAKFDADGNLQWDNDARAIGDYSGNRAWGVAVDGPNLYIVGRTTDAGQGGADIFVVKLLLEDGSTVWQKTLGQPESYSWEYGYGISVGKTGVFITADARDPIFNQHSAYLAKLSKNGDLIWQKAIAGFFFGTDRGDCVVVDSLDNVYMSGYADYPVLLDPQTNGNTRRDLILVKYSSAGELIYQKAIGQSGEDYSSYSNSHHNLAIDGDFLWITGYSELRSQGYPIGFIAHISADGDNEGVYGDYLIQPTDFFIGDSNLILDTADLANVASGISINSESTSNGDIDDYQFKISYRAPFELNTPNGTITAGIVRAKELRLGDIPIKSSRPSDPYSWQGHNLYAGQDAGFSSQDGAYHNIVIGKYSGVHNTYGSNNIFFGKGAGYYNTTGYSNTFIGRNAGYYNSTGSYNVSIGHDAGQSQYEGDHNVVIGNTSVVDGNTDYQLAIGSNGDWWLRGDSARSVYINTNLIFNQSSTQIIMKSPNGAQWSVQVDNSGNLTAVSV